MRLLLLQTGFIIYWLLFVFAFGACVGSLINVLVYRMPRGISVITPPSACPKCHTRLRWRDNIPVLGWIMLRGKCRYCQAPISAEYPIVEAIVGALFALALTACFLIPPGADLLGVPIHAVRPDWAQPPNRPGEVFPIFLILLTLLGSLIAMTIVDARTFTIPLALAWVPAIVGIVGAPLAALWAHSRTQMGLRAPAETWSWAIASPGPYGWYGVGLALGGAAGVLLSNVLLRLGLLRQSFADYDEWEKQALADAAAEAATEGETAGSAVETGQPTAADSAGAAHMWIQYPHARREMFKELLFVGPPIALALIGGMVAVKLAGAGPSPVTGAMTAKVAVPLWLDALSGALLGYLVGAGVVWGVRILGSLGFGKEAMGLGDVHLMAAVGACLGWIDATLAFFGAAFVGLAWTILAGLSSGRLNRAMPYGPFLAVSTILVWLFKPAIEVGLGALLGHSGPVSLP
ncbi:MAG: prepilin peptidase [Phycisphaerales bacterium JB039]